jgi:hypothetical protein
MEVNAPSRRDGLEKTHAAGMRYPIPITLWDQAEFPNPRQELEPLRDQERSRRRCTR